MENLIPGLGMLLLVLLVVFQWRAAGCAPRQSYSVFGWATLLVVTLLGMFIWFSARDSVPIEGKAIPSKIRMPGKSETTSPPLDLSRVDYQGSRSCRKCHQDHYSSWYDTYHRTMTREATPENIRGDIHQRIYSFFNTIGPKRVDLFFNLLFPPPRSGKIDKI